MCSFIHALLFFLFLPPELPQYRLSTPPKYRKHSLVFGVCPSCVYSLPSALPSLLCLLFAVCSSFPLVSTLSRLLFSLSSTLLLLPSLLCLLFAVCSSFLFVSTLSRLLFLPSCVYSLPSALPSLLCLLFAVCSSFLFLCLTLCRLLSPPFPLCVLFAVCSSFPLVSTLPSALPSLLCLLFAVCSSFPLVSTLCRLASSFPLVLPAALFLPSCVYSEPSALPSLFSLCVYSLPSALPSLLCLLFAVCSSFPLVSTLCRLLFLYSLLSPHHHSQLAGHAAGVAIADSHHRSILFGSLQSQRPHMEGQVRSLCSLRSALL